MSLPERHRTRRLGAWTTLSLAAMLSVTTMPGTAADQAPTEDATVLLGKVVDEQGRPVVCGFVMLQEHVHAWAWTDGSGNFRLRATPAMLPATVLVSFAGHEPELVP